jgi:hypothetical protein
VSTEVQSTVGILHLQVGTNPKVVFWPHGQVTNLQAKPTICPTKKSRPALKSKGVQEAVPALWASRGPAEIREVVH